MGKRKKIYLSGPISDRDYEEAKEHFSRMEDKLHRAGYDVFNPLEYGEKIFDGCVNVPWYAYMESLLPCLRECDAIYMLDGWVSSHGSIIERIYAERCGLRVMYEEEVSKYTTYAQCIEMIYAKGLKRSERKNRQ